MQVAGDGNLNQGDGSGAWGRITSPLGLCSGCRWVCRRGDWKEISETEKRG